MKLSRLGIAALFSFTGAMHFLRPRFFEAIELVNEGKKLLGNLEAFLGPASGILEQFLP